MSLIYSIFISPSLLQAINKNSHTAAIRGAVLTFLLVGAAGLSARSQAAVSTVAGSGTAGSADGPALTA